MRVIGKISDDIVSASHEMCRNGDDVHIIVRAKCAETEIKDVKSSVYRIYINFH